MQPTKLVEKRMRIGFDGKRALRNFTGLGNYSRYVLEGLYSCSSAHEWRLYSPRAAQHPRALRFLANCPQLPVILPQGIWKKLSSLWRVWGITSRLQQEVDVFHGLSNELPLNIRGVRTVVTIHDLIFRHYPQTYTWIDRHIYDYKFRRACKLADCVVAVSECTKRDIVHYYGIPAEKIEVVYQGCDPQFNQSVSPDQIRQILTKYQLPTHYILNVGSIEERKNVLLAAEALEYLPADTHLVIVGKHTPYTTRVEQYVQAHGLTERVHFLHQAAFPDFPALYQGADVFVYPSRFEGFGIPILEALCSGTPVVAATGSCLEEAGGPDSLYVHPDDKKGLAQAILRIQQDEALRARMVQQGKAYAQRFSQQQQTQQLLTIYQRLTKQ